MISFFLPFEPSNSYIRLICSVCDRVDNIIAYRLSADMSQQQTRQLIHTYYIHGTYSMRAHTHTLALILLANFDLFFHLPSILYWRIAWALIALCRENGCRAEREKKVYNAIKRNVITVKCHIRPNERANERTNSFPFLYFFSSSLWYRWHNTKCFNAKTNEINK